MDEETKKEIEVLKQKIAELEKKNHTQPIQYILPYQRPLYFQPAMWCPYCYHYNCGQNHIIC